MRAHTRGFLTLSIACTVGVLGVAWLEQAQRLLAQFSRPTIVIGDGVYGPEGMAWVPDGEFLMGSDHKLAQPNERPAHKVRVRGFWMDRHHVTNAQFREFVEATGYVTTAERKPDWATIAAQLPVGTARPPEDALVPGAMVFTGTPDTVDYAAIWRWWRYIPGANWRHPQGPSSGIADKDLHPVVQVSYEDAQAYAKWVGKRLPSEAEWEFAARGGLEQATYVWGDVFAPDQQQMANVWQGQQAQPFPIVSAKAGGAAGTSPAGTFPANGYGLYDMTGNAWQWVADWYRADQFQIESRNGHIPVDPQGPAASWDPGEPGVPDTAPKRVTRGGSFLCNQSFCLSYRPSARHGTDPYTSMSHLGFRLVMSDEEWRARQSSH
ncbi:formylglycine-generating enzyme family protein [Aquipseudomonas alcaligenes]|uniref:formylglycine-generating enzyme family protein n=1 Tax=Aquipseudomonas alcaligenes TaxID=43263 RepID=UPI0037485675